MSKNLVIVESPAKAKTIENYLGKNYEVMASVGHIVDLPSKKLGVDIENNFEPTYEIIEGKEKVVAKLKKAASTADNVYIASDPDREGEAIAWHVQEQIKGKNSNIYRVQFNEITKQGIIDGISNPGGLNMNRVDAQQSRRILDRLVGYQVSPLLWKPLKYGLSAGRVQSVALRLVCEREDEIEKFVTEESWSLAAEFDVLDGGQRKGTLKAMLDKEDGKKAVLKTEADADKVIEKLDGKEFRVSSVEKKSVKSSSPQPFTTARLQQEAIRKIGLTARATMATAQQLYEGVELGSDGPTGLITYMRTDSTRIAPEAAKEAEEYIKKSYGDDFLTKGKRKAPSKQKVQDAHEAIRPTSVSLTPDKVKSYLNPNQFKLYKLIWERFIASQMADALYEQTTVLIDADIYQFRASGRVMTFAGFTVLYTEAADEDAKAEDNPAFLNVSEANSLKHLNYEKKQHFTQPPPRFTEASIVRMLEQQGIGRPSTYASIISTIVDREYVEIKEKRIHPTELGRIVTKLLVQNFPQVFDVKFTAHMEEGLDKIEDGSAKWLDVLNDFYGSFSDELKKAAKNFNADLRLDINCPQCGKPLAIKNGKNGPFVACTGYPDCSFTSDFERTPEGEIQFVARKGPESTGISCDKCGSEMMIKRGPYGEMLACSAYPDCKNIKNFIRLPSGDIRVLEPGEKLGGKCPVCSEGDIVLKSGRNGIFAACSRYPSCKFTANVEAGDDGKLTIKAPKEQEEAGVCDKCGKPMVVKRSFRGPFLACSGYPDCKNTKSLKSASGGRAKKSADTGEQNSSEKKAAPAKKTTSVKKAASAKKVTPSKKTAPAAKSAAPKKTTAKKPAGKKKS